ncbi:MAG: carbamate kinase [Haloarculaceae archaeon]
MDRLVVALGGNALLRAGESTAASQLLRVRETARHVVDVLESGHEVVLTHGNGPQVGNRILQQEASDETPTMPLDVLVAETQAQIGYLLQQALDNELRASGAETADFVTMVTQVVVDPDDPDFETPTKPVGPFYTEAEAAERSFETAAVGRGERPYRRVVPSPSPTDVVEVEEIESTVETGTHVVCAGGGGVPVVDGDEGYEGVEAVVDKDRTSALLASKLDADALVVLTDVEYAYRGYDTDDPEPIESLTPAEAASLLEGRAFGTGSMKPKVEACRSFVAGGGERAVITSPDRLRAGLAGETGTQFRP